MRVGPDAEDWRQHPEEPRVGGPRLAVAEDAVEDEDDDPEERVGEQLGSKAPARGGGERDQEHGEGGRRDPGAPVPGARDHQREHSDAEQTLQDRQTGAPGVLRHEGEHDLAQVLVVDPRLIGRRVGVGGRRREVAAREDVLPVADMSPEIGVRPVDGGEDEPARQQQRDEQSTTEAVGGVAAR